MKIVKTLCDNCIFHDNGCLAGRETTTEVENGKSRVFTSGYCHVKRDSVWGNANKDLAVEHKLAKTVQEDTEISVIIMAKDAKMPKIKKTLESLYRYPELFRQVIIVTHKLDAKLIDKLVKYLQTKASGVLWNIENISVDEFYEMARIDAASRFAEKNWLMTLVAGDTLTTKQVEYIKSVLSFKSSNALLFYFDKDDSVRILTSIYAFNELDRNIEMPYFEKVKTFQDWEKVCYKFE